MADLSPAAQAVLDTTKLSFYESPPTAVLAAWILRALADHQSPAWDGTSPACHWSPDERTRQELRNLAEKLEGANG